MTMSSYYSLHLIWICQLQYNTTSLVHWIQNFSREKSHGESPVLKKNWSHHNDAHCPVSNAITRCFVKQDEASHLFLWEQVAFPISWQFRLLACSKFFPVCIQINCIHEVEITVLSGMNLYTSGMCPLMQTWWVLCVVVAFCDCVYDLSRIVPVFNIEKLSSVMSGWKKDERASAKIYLLLAQHMLVTLCEHHILKLPFCTSLEGVFMSVRANLDASSCSFPPLPIDCNKCQCTSRIATTF